MIEKESFIIYEEEGISELDKLALKDALNMCPYDYKIAREQNGKITFEKIVKNNSEILDGPHLVGKTLSMNVYNTKEMEKFAILNGFNSIGDKKIIDVLYSVKDINMFKMFAESVSFNAVFYNDTENDMLIINGKDNKLFYGYSRINGSILFSNNYHIISRVVTNVLEMPKNSYYLNGDFISLINDKKLVLK